MSNPISVFVNVDNPIDPPMLEALTRFEVQCCVLGKKTTTGDEIRQFLSGNYSNLADSFAESMMVKIPNS